MNVRLLRKVKDHILADPRRLVMRVLAVKKGSDFATQLGNQFSGDWAMQEFAPCGTAACIAGWTLILSGDMPFTMNNGEGANVLDAASLLEIDTPLVLFFVSTWPEKYRTAFEAAASPWQRAKITAERIEHYIETKL